jgi:hypothetical protein
MTQKRPHSASFPMARRNVATSPQNAPVNSPAPANGIRDDDLASDSFPVTPSLPSERSSPFACLKCLAPSVLRDQRTHAIARNESDANAKKEQDRLIHVPPAYLKLMGGSVARELLRDLTEDPVNQVAG